MAQRRSSAKFHVICSDQPRNGKTLLARLLADYLILCERPPLIFDAAPVPGGIRGYFPARSYKVELSTTAGQMGLFDRALERPLHDCVVDLPAHLVGRVFGLMGEIGFGHPDHTPDMAVLIHFVVDRSVDSLLAGRKLRADSYHDRLIAVRNEAIVPTFTDPVAKSLYDGLAKQGQIIVPALDKAVMAVVEDPSFSFSNFAQEIPADLPYLTRETIKFFLARVYRQFDLLGLGSDSAQYEPTGQFGPR